MMLSFVFSPSNRFGLDMSWPSSAFKVGALDVDDLLGVAGHVNEALVIGHRANHVDVTHLGVLVGLVVINLDLDGLEVSVLEQAAHRLTELVQHPTDLLRGDGLVHVVGANLAGLAALLIHQVSGFVILVNVAGEVHVRCKGH